MSDIDIEEGYQRVHKAFENINFNAATYDTIKLSLIEYLRLNYAESFNDWIESSDVIQIIEAFAYVGEMLMYRVDMNAHENFISHATRKESILRLARLIGYISSRRSSARGLVRIDSISTSESVRDTRGTELSNRVIKWNDSSNVNWQEQFFTVISLILKQNFGDPIKSMALDEINYDLYGTRIDGLQNGVFPYAVRTAQKNVRLELVSGALTDVGTAEATPDLEADFRVFYRNDNLGVGSNGTGFMIQTVQGELIRSVYDFDQPIPNRKLILPHDGINNTDVHVAELASVDGDAQLHVWNRVDSMRGENLYFNPEKERKNYEAITLDNDGLEIHFGDSAFATIPIGPFSIWTRTAEADPVVIPRAKFKEKEFSFTYYDSEANAQTATMRFTLMNSLNNGSPSEDLERIRSVAPSMYYTQDRMVNSRDYNEFLFQDTSVLKLKAVNRTFSGASKYQKFQDASGNYQNIKLFGDDLRIYIDDGYSSQVFSRGEGATETQLIDRILEDVLYKKEVQDHLITIQGVTSPRTKFRELVDTQLTYTGNAIESVIDVPYPQRGHTQEKTEIQGRIDGKYYGSFGGTGLTYPVDALAHLDQNMNVYILEFEIPAASRYKGVMMSNVVQGVTIEGLSTGATGVVQSIYPLAPPDPVQGVYAGYDSTYSFINNNIDTSIGALYVNGSLVSSGATIVDATTLDINATTTTSITGIELRLPSITATHVSSVDTWFIAGADVGDGSIYINGVQHTGFVTIAPTTIEITDAADALQNVELRYDTQIATDYGATTGDATWFEKWTFIGSPKSVIEGTVYINGVAGVAGVDYVLPSPFVSNEIWTQFASPATVELMFDPAPASHVSHIASWTFPGTVLSVGDAAATLVVDANAVSTATYTVTSANTIDIDATASQSIVVEYEANQGVLVSGIDRWTFSGTTFAVHTDYASVWIDGAFVDPLITTYTLTQTSASTAEIQIEASALTTSLQLEWNESALVVIEAESITAVLSFDDYEELNITTPTGNLNVDNGVGGRLLSQSNTLFTYQLQDGSGGGIGNKSLGLHTGGVNSGATSNGAFGIGYDRLVDQYYTISPEDLGAESAKFSREFSRDLTGNNLDDSWLLRIKPIRSGGETQYLVGNREVELMAHGIEKDFFYQNDRNMQNKETGLIVEDTFAILGTNLDIRAERTVGANLSFPVVRQPLNAITGRQERKNVIIKPFDTDQDGIPDDRHQFSRVVDVFSPDVVLAFDGRNNNLSEGEFQVARDAASVYGAKPHVFDFGESFINWQERTNYYGDGSWAVNTPYNLSWSATNGGSNPTLNGGSSLIGGGIKYDLPAGVSLSGGYDVFFNGLELPTHVFALEATAFHIAFESFMGYLTPLGTESLELRPRGIMTEFDDNIQLTSAPTMPGITDFTIETIINLRNTGSVSLVDAFRRGGYDLDNTTIQLIDSGWRLEVVAVSSDVANAVSITFGDGVLSDRNTYVTPSTTITHQLESDPVALRNLPHSADFNDDRFHHIAVVRSTVLEYQTIDLLTYNDGIKIGDKVIDANGSTALVWDRAEFDQSGLNGAGRLWLYDINLADGFTELGMINESLAVMQLRPDGTFGDNIALDLRMTSIAYKALKFFVDGVGSVIYNLSTDYPAAVEFNAVPTHIYSDCTLLSNRVPRPSANIPAGQEAIIHCEGITISRSARYGENFNDVFDVYKKYPRIFPQTVFFRRPDTLSDFEVVLQRPTPTIINADIASGTPNQRLYEEFVGRDNLHYLWTHFSPRANLIDPSKTNIIDIFVHTYGYQKELEEWLGRDDIFEPQPQAPSSLDLKTAYGKYLSKGMLSDTIIMHSGRIKYLFGTHAPAELRAKFRVVKRSDSNASDEQLKSLILGVINSFFAIRNWDFGTTFYFTELVTAIHTQLPNDVQSIVLVPSAGISRFGDLFQVTPADDEILQSAAKLSDIEVIAGLTRQNIRRSED